MKLAIVGVMLALAAVPGWGSVVMYSTLGPGDSFDQSQGLIIGSSFAEEEIAVSFVAGFEGTLHSIRVAVAHSAFTNNYTVLLAQDNSGEPGAALETFSGVAFPLAASILDLSSVTNPGLSAGATYWVVVTAPDLAGVDGVWFRNDQGIADGFSFRDSFTSGEWSNTPGSRITPALAVMADPAIPEPSTILLGLTGLAAIALARRRTLRRPGPGTA